MHHMSNMSTTSGILAHVRTPIVAGVLALGAFFAFTPAGLVARQTAPAAPVYDVRVELDPPSVGTTTFVVDKTGKVTGRLHVETPNVVDATLAGTVKAGVWTFEYTFAMPVQGCNGNVSGTAKVSADQNTVAGTMNIGGECVPQPMTAPFTFTKRAK
jgi:hypothetical protein